MLCTDRSIYERSTSQYLVDDDDEEEGEGEGEEGEEEEISVFTYLDQSFISYIGLGENTKQPI